MAETRCGLGRCCAWRRPQWGRTEKVCRRKIEKSSGAQSRDPIYTASSNVLAVKPQRSIVARSGEGEDRADTHAEFFEGELRMGEQWAYSSCGFHSGCSAWYSNDPGAYSRLGRPAAAAASRSLITASALRRVTS